MSNLPEQFVINKIEYIIRWKDFGDEYTREDVEVIEELYNLYQNLQKEIKELKEKEKNLLKQLKDSEKELLEVTRNIINKDKIKAKIEELKLIADNGINAVRFAVTHDDEIERIQKQEDISVMIDILQSLLEKEQIWVAGFIHK